VYLDPSRAAGARGAGIDGAAGQRRAEHVAEARQGHLEHLGERERVVSVAQGDVRRGQLGVDRGRVQSLDARVVPLRDHAGPDKAQRFPVEHLSCRVVQRSVASVYEESERVVRGRRREGGGYEVGIGVGVQAVDVVGHHHGLPPQGELEQRAKLTGKSLRDAPVGAHKILSISQEDYDGVNYNSMGSIHRVLINFL